jgi:hypothetical protein
MCSIKSIRLGVQSLSILKIFLSFYIFGAGCLFCGSYELQQAYGLAYVGYGVQLIFAGLISLLAIVPHWYANKRHNRFLLVTVFTMDTLVLIIVAVTATTMQTYLPPLFPKDLQLDCLRNVPQIYSLEECTPFYNSPRTAGFRLFWEGKYTDRKNTRSFQVMATVQGDICCGFFAPLNCIPNTNKFPPDRSEMNINPIFLKQEVSCGNITGYYPQTDICTDYYKSAAINPVVGGCNWDLGIGFCTEADVTPSTIGCASAVEDYVGGLITPHITFLLLTTAIIGITMLYSCCMLWKRREEDVFPELVNAVRLAFYFSVWLP